MALYFKISDFSQAVAQ